MIKLQKGLIEKFSIKGFTFIRIGCIFCSIDSLRVIPISEIPEISRNYPFVPLVTGKPPNIPLKGPIPDSPLF